MALEPGGYEARYGWNGRTIRLTAGAMVFVVLAIVLPLSLPLRVAALVLFGGGLVLLLAGVLTRRVALRVDGDGVTLGGSPLRYRAGTQTVPWAHIAAVVLWRQPLPYGSSMRWVGLQRHKGAPALAGRRSRKAARAVAHTLIPVSGDTLLASRAVNSWRLDTGRLAAAVAHFAPGVPVIDDETGRKVSQAGA